MTQTNGTLCHILHTHTYMLYLCALYVPVLRGGVFNTLAKAAKNE